MYLMRNHDVWIYVRCANSDPRIAFDRLYDLIDEAAGHGFLVRGTSFDHCSGNTLKDRIGLRTMLDAVENGRIEAVMVRDLEQISRNSYILVGVIEILRQNDVYLITTECDLNAELINSGLERFVGDRFTRASFGKPRCSTSADGSVLRGAAMTEYKVWAYARSAAPNLPALEEQLAEVMREADRRGYIIVNSCMEQKCGTEFWRPDLFAILTAVQQGRVNAVMVQSLDRLSHDITTLYRILRFLQNYGAVLITTETNLQYELYLTGLESRILARTARTGKRVPWEVAVDAD